ncbi:MAG: CPBP family intramembrane metalloprotease [Clostridiaceae bacterium]|jgi:membrane protease YdiL (CAAX protease family)|nr:CPBP family intramembrane metalloprotease [Clostridiaceae bacterium]
MKNTFKKILKVLLYCIGFGSLNLILQFIVTIPYISLHIILYSGSQPYPEDPNTYLSAGFEEALNSTLIPVLLSAGILTFGLAWLIHVLFKRDFFERLYFNKTTVPLITAGFIIGLSLQIPVSDFIETIKKINVMPDALMKYEKIMESMITGQSFILQVVTIGILIPILEEIIYRGLIFDQLRKNIPLTPALIIQALIFGIIHLNIVQSSYAFLLGILMGLALVRSGSILLPIAIHIGMNLSGVILSEFHPSISNTMEWVLRIASYALAIVCIVFMLYKTKNKATFEA